MTELPVPKVFLSYSHDSDDHAARVLELANALRRDGIDVSLDRYNPTPSEGWPRWTEQNLDVADFVLMVCTPTYLKRVKGQETPGVGLGVQWEGNLIYNSIYRNASQGERFIPILLDGADVASIPTVVFGHNSYRLSLFHINDSQYQTLYRHLTRQPETTAPELGALIRLNSLPKLELPSAPPWNVPPRNPFFTGREDTLTLLDDTLRKATSVAITQPAAISGLGGIGKTQTAVEYAHRHQGEYDAVLWMRAETETTLRESFVTTARLLGLPAANEQDQNLAVEATKRWLATETGWLLILDNADGLAMAHKFLPDTSTGHILYTTRAATTGRHAKPVRLDKLRHEEGALLLLRRAKILDYDALLDAATPEDREAALLISEQVDGLPLALDQAGAFIEEQQTSVSRYLDHYKKQAAKLLADYGDTEDRDHASVAITFSLAFEKAEAANPAVGDLLRLCAFLDSDDIPELIFTQGDAGELGEHLSPIVDDGLAWDKLLGEACRYSLLSRDANKGTLSLHRLVQVVLRDAMTEDIRRVWAERAIGLVNNALPDIDFKNWSLYDQLLSHALACATWITIVKIETSKASRLLIQTGHYLYERAQYDQAEPLYLESLSIYRRQLGSDHPDTASCLNNLAVLYQSQGRYVDSEPLYLEALSIRRRQLGPDHPDTAISLNNSAELYRSQGRYVDAEPLYLEALEIHKRQLGPDHPDTATSLNNLALLYHHQGRYVDAEPLYLEALEIHKRQLGLDHPRTATSLNNLALLYDSQGRYLDAEPLYLDALSIRKRQLGPDHPDTATSLNNLAIFYYYQGHYIKAKSYIEQALLICLRSLGTEHPDTIGSQQSYVDIVRKLQEQQGK